MSGVPDVLGLGVREALQAFKDHGIEDVRVKFTKVPAGRPQAGTAGRVVRQRAADSGVEIVCAFFKDQPAPRQARAEKGG